MPRHKIPACKLKVGHVIRHTAYGDITVRDVKFTGSSPTSKLRVEAGTRVLFMEANRMVDLVWAP